MIDEHGYIDFWECPNCGSIFRPTPNSVKYHTYICVMSWENIKVEWQKKREVENGSL